MISVSVKVRLSGQAPTKLLGLYLNDPVRKGHQEFNLYIQAIIRTPTCILTSQYRLLEIFQCPKQISKTLPLNSSGMILNGKQSKKKKKREHNLNLFAFIFTILTSLQPYERLPKLLSKNMKVSTKVY